MPKRIATAISKSLAMQVHFFIELGVFEYVNIKKRDPDLSRQKEVGFLSRTLRPGERLGVSEPFRHSVFPLALLSIQIWIYTLCLPSDITQCLCYEECQTKSVSAISFYLQIYSFVLSHSLSPPFSFSFFLILWQSNKFAVFLNNITMKACLVYTFKS